MDRFLLSAVLGVVLSAGAAYAGEHDCDCKPGEICPPRCTRPVCMNIACAYEKKEEGREKECKVQVKMVKEVTKEGGEVADDSAKDKDEPVQMEVECDGKTIYSADGGARRFTGLLGSRIQALTGPFPAITLPRGELHEGDHFSRSTLELGNDADDRIRGSCFIYPGQP